MKTSQFDPKAEAERRAAEIAAKLKRNKVIREESMNADKKEK